MNIVHLIASTGLYGAEKWILALMRAMQPSDVNSVLANLSDDHFSTSAVVTGARDRGLEAFDFYTGGTFNPLAVIRFSRWLKTKKIDIVHGHGYKSDIIGLLAARFAGCKILTTPHGWSKEQDTKLQFYESLDRLSFRFMDHVCPLSEELMESVKEHILPEKIRLILNGVDIDEIDSCQPAFEKKHNEFIIGYIGRLVEGKDLPTLLQAVKQLVDALQADQSLKVRLLIVGDGEEAKTLGQLVNVIRLQNHVEFLGFHNDAISYLKCFDLFVLPSLSEGIPRCLMESMAAKVPVVASDIRGNRVLVEHGVTGLLFPAGSSDDLFLILRNFTTNRHQHNNIVKEARELITTTFSNKTMAKEYGSLYQLLLNEEQLHDQGATK